MNSSYETSMNVASGGFCIVESMGLYIANRHVVGFKSSFYDGDNVIKLYTTNSDFIIYKHVGCIYDFNVIAKKIITNIIDKLRYNNDTNIHIDKIISEVLNSGE